MHNRQERTEPLSNATSDALIRLPFAFEGQLATGVRWAGTRFDAVVRPDWEEIERRREASLGAVLDFQLLQALSLLSGQTPLPWDQVDPIVAAVLDCAPPGTIEATSDQVQLLLRPPVELVGVFTISDHWHAMKQVGVLARTAPTGIVVRGYPDRLDEGIALANRFGLGLALLEDHEPIPVVAPTTTAYHTMGRRRIVEVVFKRWLSQTGMPANSHQASS